MAEDVTLEDLQKVDKRLQVLEAATKELARLLKIQEEYGKDMAKIAGDDGKESRDAAKKMDARVTALEKSAKAKK